MELTCGYSVAGPAPRKRCIHHARAMVNVKLPLIATKIFNFALGLTKRLSDL